MVCIIWWEGLITYAKTRVESAMRVNDLANAGEWNGMEMHSDDTFNTFQTSSRDNISNGDYPVVLSAFPFLPLDHTRSYRFSIPPSTRIASHQMHHISSASFCGGNC
jgi:hypothetical protein